MTRLYAMISVAFLAALIGGTALYVSLQSPQANMCDASSTAGAAIGGPFELLDSGGNLVTDEDVIDRPALVYFGYTFCPDACPFDMARNVDAVGLLKEAGHDVRPVFVSIDPERDTPEVMGEYQTYLYPDLVGLTGSSEQVKAAADAYKVFYSRAPGEDDEFYLMDHTTFTYLMFPGNKLGAFFRREESAEKIASSTACLIDNQ